MIDPFVLVPSLSRAEFARYLLKSVAGRPELGNIWKASQQGDETDDGVADEEETARWMNMGVENDDG